MCLEDFLAINDLNEDAAESAPQQQVTNGWVARDLLTLLAEQLNDISNVCRTDVRSTCAACQVTAAANDPG